MQVFYTFLFIALCLLSSVAMSAQAAPIICDDPAGWYRMKFELPADANSIVKAEFLTLDAKKNYVVKDKTTCETSEELVKRGLAGKIRASCWVQYGPDGGQSFSLLVKEPTASAWHATLTPFGPTGSGKTVDVVCH